MQTDVLIIGSGIAGATAALRLAEDRQRQITLITRTGDPEESNSSFAQGGIIGQGEDDSDIGDLAADALSEDELQDPRSVGSAVERLVARVLGR